MYQYSQVFKKPDIQNPEDIEEWLSLAFTFVAPIMPRLQDDNTTLMAIAGGNPAILFLIEYSEHITRMCNYLVETNAKKYSQKFYMIELPLIVDDFNTRVFPVYQRVKDNSIDILRKKYPEYADALLGSQEHTGNIGNDGKEGE